MTRRRDWLIHQLPVGMVDDDFLVRFLRIFQDLSDTLLHQVDTLPHVFDPAVAPDPMVRTMASWLGIDFIDSSMPDAWQRRIVQEYSQLLSWRGTRRGIQQLLELVTGADVTIIDSGGVYLEGESPALTPHVVITIGESQLATDEDLLWLVRDELPASLTFELSVGGRLLWPVAMEAAAADVPTAEMATVGMTTEPVPTAEEHPDG